MTNFTESDLKRHACAGGIGLAAGILFLAVSSIGLARGGGVPEYWLGLRQVGLMAATWSVAWVVMAGIRFSLR
jgi:hypothetical protein